MRKIFERAGGQLGSTGCVAWMFEQKGAFVVCAEQADEDTLMEVALEAGADDVTADGDVFEMVCAPASFSAVKQALADREIETVSAQVAMTPTNTVQVEGEEARKVLGLIEALEDHDDVQNVAANFEISDEMMAEVSGG
jgi:transcriptional/translational regulatory protein YebC/TACO1